MSGAARRQQGLGSEQLRVNNKNEHLPTHDYHIGQSVMYLNPINKDGTQPESKPSAKNPEVTR